MRGWRVGSIRGISIEINSSWIIIFLLVWGDLADGGLWGVHGSVGQVARWLAAFITALLFFGSVLLHELSHSFVARWQGLEVSRITLFVFGGVAQMEDEPRNAKQELLISLAGPGMSLLLAVVFGALFWLASTLGQAAVARAVVHRVAIANLILAIFNMAPGFPMDGGRVVRALLWWRWHDLLRATKVASILGQAVGYALAALGLFLGITTHSIVVAIFNGGMGLLLVAVARAGYRREHVRASLSRIPMGSLIGPVELAFPAGTLLSQAAPYLASRQPLGWVPIMELDRPLGVLSADAVRGTPVSLWPVTAVEQVMSPLSEEMVVRHSTPALDVYERIAEGGLPGVLVLDDWGNLRGVVTSGDLQAALAAAG